jgi:hypothetical protein
MPLCIFALSYNFHSLCLRYKPICWDTKPSIFYKFMSLSSGRDLPDMGALVRSPTAFGSHAKIFS